MPDYRVEIEATGPLMIRAKTQAGAIRFATKQKVKIALLTTDDAIKLAKEGQELLDATDEPDDDGGAPLLDQLKVGDVAFVNKGVLEGTKVTVEGIDGEVVSVKWFEGEDCKDGSFSLADLTISVEQPETTKSAGRQRGK